MAELRSAPRTGQQPPVQRGWWVFVETQVCPEPWEGLTAPVCPAVLAWPWHCPDGQHRLAGRLLSCPRLPCAKELGHWEGEVWYQAGPAGTPWDRASLRQGLCLSSMPELGEGEAVRAGASVAAAAGVTWAGQQRDFLAKGWGLGQQELAWRFVWVPVVLDPFLMPSDWHGTGGVARRLGRVCRAQGWCAPGLCGLEQGTGPL